MADYQVLGDYIVSEKMRENTVGTMHRGIVAPDGALTNLFLSIVLITV